MKRRSFLERAAVLPIAFSNPIALHAQPTSSSAASRLDQGPFEVEQDQGWQTILFTTPSEKPIRNPGLGLVGYTWEENGPSLAARNGRETLEQAVQKLSALPFVDVLYIRCDWRNVQKHPGRLDLDPVWKLTLDAARRQGLRVAFRIQLSNPEFQPEQIALPDFLRDRVPLVKIGKLHRHGSIGDYVEPRYDSPGFMHAFLELNHLLAAEFDDNPLIEWMDLMMYGFWGEGHTSDLPNPFPDYGTAERTFKELTAHQLEIWKRTPLAVNTQPDISSVGNSTVLKMSMAEGAWLRTDSIRVEEPIQIDQLTNRPPWSAAIVEDGELRQYDIARLRHDAAGVNDLENRMLHALDVGANYWALWTEADNLSAYNQRYPRGFERLRSSLGYRLRPAWVWQRKRHGTFELIAAVANRGVSGIPGVLLLQLESPDKSLQMRGTLDRGQPASGGIRQAGFLLPRGFAGSVRLSAQLEIRPGNIKPVAWACEQPVNADGSITIDIKPENDPGWRKGV